MNYYGTDLFGTPYMQFMSSKSAKTADNKTPSKHRSMEHLLKSPCIQVLIRESLKKSVEQSPKHQTQYVISSQHIEMIKNESPHNNSIAQFPKIERFSNIHLSKPKVKKQKDPSQKKVHLPKRNAGRFQMFAPQNDGLNTLNISAKPIHFKKMKINDSFLNQSLEIQKQEIIEQLKQRVKLQQKEERRAEIKQSLHQKVHREPISQTTRINQIKMEPIVKKQKKKPQKFDGIYFKDPKYPQDPIFQEKYASMRSYFNIMNLSNRLFVQPVFNSYKAYVSKGNNGMLVRMILKNRWWWSIIDEQEQCHFIWTQLKVNTIHDNMKSLIKNTNESFSCVSASSSTLTTVGSIAITKQDEQSDTEASIPKSGAWNKFLTQTQLRKYQQITQKNAKLLTLEKAQQFEQKLTIYNEPVKVHNHLENNFHLGNKKALFYNMRAYYENQGLNVFNSLPLTFHVKSPDCPEYNQFVEAFKARQELMIKIDQESQEKKQESQEKKQIKNIWIIKPGEITNRGNGIRISEDLNEIISILNSKELHKNGSYKTNIVQLYIDRPLLYNKRKFDIRCYSMMTSINGNQKGYWYTEGYVRTSSKEFSNKNLTNKMVHLTNDAIQKKGEEYGRFERGNKVSFDEFSEYVANLGGDFTKIYARMKQMATDEFRSVYGKIDPNRKENTFEIFGLDFMIDDSFDVWIIEVNTNPSIEICCPLLSKLIPQMLDNAFKIALDPIFPPPNFYNPKKIICDQYIENKFELVFDEERDGPQLSNENPQYDIGLIEEESEEEEEDVPQ